jgi:type II restriction enzyme
MATQRQLLGEWGERLVAKMCACPKCKRPKTLRRLPVNFKCADLICDFCGFLAQVKAATSVSVDKVPQRILGAAWGPQAARMDAGIYFPLFIVLRCSRKSSIFYLPTDFQSPALFSARRPLSSNAKRSGWQGFTYVMSQVPDGALVRLL